MTITMHGTTHNCNGTQMVHLICQLCHLNTLKLCVLLLIQSDKTLIMGECARTTMNARASSAHTVFVEDNKWVKHANLMKTAMLSLHARLRQHGLLQQLAKD